MCTYYKIYIELFTIMYMVRYIFYYIHISLKGISFLSCWSSYQMSCVWLQNVHEREWNGMENVPRVPSREYANRAYIFPSNGTYPSDFW